jgi:hypothetical protein
VADGKAGDFANVRHDDFSWAGYNQIVQDLMMSDPAGGFAWERTIGDARPR